jgi:glycosyltransferase involved in cell wall biosynthesis
MRIGFHYHVSAWQQPDGSLLVPPYLGRFIDELARYYDGITAFLHRHPTGLPPSAYTYVCQAKNLEIVLLPPSTHPLNRMFLARSFVRPAAPYRGQLDALILRVPTVLARSLWQTLDCPPTGLLVVGDMVEYVNRASVDRFRRLWRLVIARLVEGSLQSVARRSVVVTNGPELATIWRQRVPQVIESATGTLYHSEIRRRDDQFSQPVIRLLFVGRATDALKSPRDAVEAVAHLAAYGERATLDVAGLSADAPLAVQLADLATNRGLVDALTFHGFVRLNPELLVLYDRADALIVPSRWEGIPRVLWEAMGRGCPVVTTPVGGIAMVTRHERECLHVPVGRPDCIAEAVLRLRRDAALRTRLLDAGLEQARRHTIEGTVADLVKAFGEADTRLAPSSDASIKDHIDADSE